MATATDEQQEQEQVLEEGQEEVEPTEAEPTEELDDTAGNGGGPEDPSGEADTGGDGEGEDAEGTLFAVDEFSLDPGGDKPKKSELVLQTGKKEIANELKRDEEVALLVHGRVEEVRF